MITGQSLLFASWVQVTDRQTGGQTPWNTTANFCERTKPQELCQEKERNCVVPLHLVHRSTVENQSTDIFNKRGQVMLKKNFTFLLRWNEIGWNDGRFFSITRSFTTKLLFSACCLFNFLLEFTNYTENSSTVMAAPCCLLSFLFPFPVSGICGEAHLFHMARGAIISSISVTSFIMREASDAQHFSLGLEQSPDHSLWPVHWLTHPGFLQHTHTHLSALLKLNQHVLQKQKTITGDFGSGIDKNGPLLARPNWTVAALLY